MRRTSLPITLVLLLVSACSSSSENSDWNRTSSTVYVATKTAPPVAENGRLPNGKYWAQVHQVLNSSSVVFLVQQARFGETCEKWATDNGMQEGCPNDYAVDSSQQLILAAPTLEWFSLANPSDSSVNYDVKRSTLIDLIRGKSVTTPDGYVWTNFPFILTVKDSEVIRAQQMWVP